MTLDQLIDRWRVINAADEHPWVLFEHGTCVSLPEPDGDLVGQARRRLALRPVQTDDPDARFSAAAHDERGWLVAGLVGDVRTYVDRTAAEAQAGGIDAVTAAATIWGRNLRDLDTREAGAVHVHDPRETPDAAAIREARAWARLVRRAEAAEREGSDWDRFGLPVAAVRLLDEDEAAAPPTPLSELDLAPDVRDTSEVLEEMVRDAPPPPRPFTLFAGLQPGPFVDAVVLDAEMLARRFPRDRVVSLTGFTSAVGRTEPALYAAKASGAMIAIRTSHAAPLTKPGDGPDEYEFLLPRDCRCRVIDVLEEGLFPDGSEEGGRSRRVTLRLEQITP